MLILNNRFPSALMTGLCLGAALLSTGCQTTTQPVVSAVSINTTPQAVEEIQQAIATIKGTPGPRLASNVFEQSSTLLIESGKIKGDDQLLLDGSYSAFPDQYTLQLRGSTCGIYYEKDDKFIALTSLTCTPVSE
ncbi:hypothetical protein [Vibrio sp. CAU 1672]|uniref:hypothetical protein n=1 Tax=Vibrio sp. CAU 1672 TaxID=3032594 RepID=UPI0023DC8EB7|nr:hypothetical protein [Vibrio sp. CAU 1672]MDF2152310.1 hypothetical protein [Vibrio sp. CAU 1672]